LPAESIRILRVIARLNMGGPALHVAYLSAGLRERGYGTTLVAGSLARGEESMAFVAQELGVPVIRLNALKRDISPLRDALSVVRLASLIRHQRPHILHTHTAKAGAIGRLAAILAGDARPPIVVHTYHGHVLSGYFDPVRANAFRLIERQLAKMTTALIAVSPQVRDDLVRLDVAPPEKFAVVRLGVELEERIPAGANGRAETRRVLGIPPSRFTVGWVGRMTGIKRTDDVLLAVRKLRERGVDACLSMVGDAPDRDHVEQRARHLGRVKHTLSIGYQEDADR
jgi:glycosyltransferase involved in cell wall biosynthesis